MTYEGLEELSHLIVGDIKYEQYPMASPEAEVFVNSAL